MKRAQEDNILGHGEGKQKREKPSIPAPMTNPTELRPTIVLKNGENKAFAFVLRNGLGTDLANKLFDSLQSFPRDARPVNEIRESLLTMNATAYAQYQRQIAGFTRDRYPFFKALSGREVLALHAPASDEKRSYKYSGQTRVALPMINGDVVHQACQRVSGLMHVPFTFALINRYFFLF